MAEDVGEIAQTNAQVMTICSGVCDLRCFGDKTPLDEPLVLFSRVSRQNNAKPHRHYFDCDSLCESITNQTQICNISSLRANPQDLRGNPFSLDSAIRRI